MKNKFLIVDPYNKWNCFQELEILGRGTDFSFSLPFARDAQVLEKDRDGKLTDGEIQLKPLAKGPEREL